MKKNTRNPESRQHGGSVQGCFATNPQQNPPKPKQNHLSVEKRGTRCNTYNPGRAKPCMDLQDYPPLPGKAALVSPQAAAHSLSPDLHGHKASANFPGYKYRRIRSRRQEGKQSRRLLEDFTNLIHPLIKVSREQSFQTRVLTLKSSRGQVNQPFSAKTELEANSSWGGNDPTDVYSLVSSL